MTTRGPLALVLGLVLAVVPGLLATIVLLAERGARQRDENRDLHTANLRTAFAAWCERDGRVLGRSLLGQAEEMGQRLLAIGWLTPFRAGDGFFRYACIALAKPSPSWPDVYVRPRFEPDAYTWHDNPPRMTGSEHSPIGNEHQLEVMLERFTAAIDDGDFFVASSIHDQIHDSDTTELANKQSHDSEPTLSRALALAAMPAATLAQRRAAVAARRDVLPDVSGNDGRPLQHALATAIAMALAQQRGAQTESPDDSTPQTVILDWLRDGALHPYAGQWDALRSLDRDLDLGLGSARLDALQAEWQNVFQRFREAGAQYRAGATAGTVGQFAWETSSGHFTKQHENLVCFLLTDPTWIPAWLDAHPCTVTVGAQRRVLNEHLVIEYTTLDSITDDLYLRVHELTPAGDDGKAWIAALEYEALAAMRPPAASASWLAVAGLVALSACGMALLGAGVVRERRQARRQRRFVAEAVHELTTPAALIRLHAETLTLQRLENAADRERYLATISGEAQRLADLVQKLLSFTRCENGELRYEFADHDLVAVVRTAVDGFAMRARNAGRALVFAPDDATLPARVDATALTQIVFNLLDNAMKYGAGTITVRLHRDEALELSIEDHGPGIAPHERTRLCAAYTRGETGREQGGTGLGLYLVRQLTHGHGGSVRLEDTPGGGLTVTIRLPRAGCAEAT